jgi:hypothetical protein
MNTFTSGNLRLHFQRNPINAFFPLLQKGFYIEITTDNIQKLLCRICDIKAEDVRDRIQTVFLNGKPVDDMESVVIQDGDCLALSAAMPGLVGATMRSGGVLAGFRHSISYRPPQTHCNSRGGVLLIKLFNLVIKDIGPRFLQQGILVGSDDLQDLLAFVMEVDRGNCITALWNAHTINADALAEIGWPEDSGLIHLEVTFGPSSDAVSPGFYSAEKLG